MSAEEAIARAKAIAARLAGTGASAAVAPESSTGSVYVNAVADAALAAAFVQNSGSGGSKRKRWGAESGDSGKCAGLMFPRCLTSFFLVSLVLNFSFALCFDRLWGYFFFFG